MAAMKEMKEMVAALEARVNSLEKAETALKAEVATLKKTAKAPKKSKSEDEAEGGEKKEKEKVKREMKPSAKSDAWRALCDAVRAVHKKDAMKIAKILKDAGNMEPTEEDIKKAATQLPEKEGSHSETEKPAKSGSESDGSEGAAKKRGRPKKVAAE
jgi:hypothetical protein